MSSVSDWTPDQFTITQRTLSQGIGEHICLKFETVYIIEIMSKFRMNQKYVPNKKRQIGLVDTYLI